MVDRICWNITNECNDNCPFCFRDIDSMPLEYKQNLIIASKLVLAGIDHIAFSGGEALLYDHLLKIAEVFKENSIRTTLISNGILLNDRDLLINCSSLFDSIALPFDTLQFKEEYTRNRNHVKTVITILEYLEKHGGRVKINTVVTHMNYREIELIYKKIINKYLCIERWNLFEFTPLRGKAKDMNSVFALNKEEDEYLVSVLKSMNIRNGLSIKYKHRQTIQNSYYVISPNGDIYSGDELIGNILYDEVEDIDKSLKIDMHLYGIRTIEDKLVII